MIECAVAEPVSVVVNPTQAVNVPVIVGWALTIMLAVTEQLLLFLYVIAVDPGDTPVTTPVEDTVATAGADDTHGVVASGVPEPVNTVVDPTQVVNDPVIVGGGLIVTVAV